MEIGNFLELRVKYYKNPYSSFLNYDGIPQGPPTPGSFLQVRPYVNRWDNTPVIHTKVNQYDDQHDLYCQQRTILRPVVLDDAKRDKETGLIELRDNALSRIRNIIDVDLHTEGLCYPVGIITDIKRNTNEPDAILAMRSIPQVTTIAKTNAHYSVRLDIRRRLFSNAVDVD